MSLARRLYLPPMQGDGADYVSISVPEFGPRKLFVNLGRAAGSESDEEFAVIWNPTEYTSRSSPARSRYKQTSGPPEPVRADHFAGDFLPDGWSAPAPLRAGGACGPRNRASAALVMNQARRFLSTQLHPTTRIRKKRLGECAGTAKSIEFRCSPRA